MGIFNMVNTAKFAYVCLEQFAACNLVRFPSERAYLQKYFGYPNQIKARWQACNRVQGIAYLNQLINTVRYAKNRQICGLAVLYNLERSPCGIRVDIKKLSNACRYFTADV